MHGHNEQILRHMDLIVGEEFSGEYAAFIEGLTEDEVKVLVNLKQRLDDAGIPTSKLEMSGPIL
jgi:hypothetical protein